MIAPVFKLSLEEFSKQLFSTVQPIVDSIKSGDFLLSIQAPVQQGKSKQTSSSTMTGKKLAKGNLSCGELFDSVGVDQTVRYVYSILALIYPRRSG